MSFYAVSAPSPVHCFARLSIDLSHGLPSRPFVKANFKYAEYSKLEEFRKLLSRNYLFNFRETFSSANNRISARPECSTDWKISLYAASVSVQLCVGPVSSNGVVANLHYDDEHFHTPVIKTDQQYLHDIRFLKIPDEVVTLVGNKLHVLALLLTLCIPVRTIAAFSFQILDESYLFYQD